MPTCHEGLKTIVSEKGLSVTENPKLLKALLNDVSPDGKLEIRLILSSLEINIIEQLRSIQGDTFDLDYARTVSQVTNDLGIREDYAYWVVNVWLDMLGIKEFASPLVLPEVNTPVKKTAPVSTGKPASGQQNIIVSPFGQADYRSISRALENAEEGGAIIVKPGLYKESLVLNRSIQITGEGNPDVIIIESTSGECVRMETESAQVRGLTFRQKSEEEFFAVVVPQGNLLLENCNITSESRSCVAVHGVGSYCEIHRCRIHDSKLNGITFYDQGSGVVEDCDIYANTQHGVSISEQANPTFRRCKIHDGKGSGIIIYENGQGVIEDCDIYSNSSAGVIIFKQANPILRRCKIHDGKKVGICIYENGQGVIEECEINSNDFSGVEISQQANPTLRRCKIHDGKSGGVFAYDSSKGLIEGCDIYANDWVGIGIKNQASPKIQNCKIHDGKSSGVYVFEKGSGEIEGCNIYSNSLAGVEITGQANPSIRRCEIHGGKGNGIRTYNNCLGIIEDSDIYSNTYCEVYIQEKANPTLKRCKIHNGNRYGILNEDDGYGVLEDCEIFKNYDKSIHTINSGKPKMIRCKVN